jgi:hypothetical protein
MPVERKEQVIAIWLRSTGNGRRESVKSGSVRGSGCNSPGLLGKSCREQMQQHERAEPELLDYLVGPDEDGRRDVHPESLGSFLIDGQVQGCGRLERQIGGRGAAQNPVDITRE